MFKTPILFIIFNRPETTKRVFESIRSIRPKELYIAADAPRKGNSLDLSLCNESRSITEKIDWPCKVKRLYRKENLGCRNGVSSAITWFFKNVKQGIILEDDCLPNKSFFYFCEELLKKYKDNKKIMQIGGNDLSENFVKSKYSYSFLNYPSVWGWATWSRAWKEFNLPIKDYEEFEKNRALEKLLRKRKNLNYASRLVAKEYYGLLKKEWSVCWIYAIWKNEGICILPNLNLVSNIGFGENMTHSSLKDSGLGDKKTQELLKITHPPRVNIDFSLDSIIEELTIDQTFNARFLRVKSDLGLFTKIYFPSLHRFLKKFS